MHRERWRGPSGGGDMEDTAGAHPGPRAGRPVAGQGLMPAPPSLADAGAAAAVAEAAARDAVDERMGFQRLAEGGARLGWLVNMQLVTRSDNECPGGRAGVDLYFLEPDGGAFKASLLHHPFLFVVCTPGAEADVAEALRRRFSRSLAAVDVVDMDDLELPNHIAANRRRLVKLAFWNVQQLTAAKRILQPVAERNAADAAAASSSLDPVFSGSISGNHGGSHSARSAGASAPSLSAIRRGAQDGLEDILGLREHDISHYIRVAIDCDIRVGLWYTVHAGTDGITLQHQPDRIQRADPVILAFDIETTKLPLKFPDAEIDSIMMISYMIDGQGFLITNRSIVSQDIHDFEFTPKPEFEGNFTIFNEADEETLLRRFIEHIQTTKPTVFVTYNGDFFDWPFVEARAAVHGISLAAEIGFFRSEAGEYTSKHAIHMDCFAWVKRDSYLPQGSQGLKAVTKYKLGYNPIEVDPEDMTRFATEQPQVLAQYSVSDAVATYYLYMKYVHPFIFSLCNIIPMNPDDVLRRGSGTLCETLLMVQAFKSGVIMPNKHNDPIGRTFEGHLLSSETYVGGHVEALEAGVFRSDLATQFRLDPTAFDQLIAEIDQALAFSITVENKLTLNDVTNYDEVRAMIIAQLEALRNTPNRNEEPLIYHLDVAAMYPNIILTNRLQPNAVIDESMCAVCDYNEGPDSTCQRRMTWSWRGEFFPATRGEVNMIHNQLEQERFKVKFQGDNAANAPPGADTSVSITRAFHELPPYEQANHLHKRVGEYSRKVYGRIHENKIVERESIVCQREHPFYVDTVRAFRDRRYEYKGLLKTSKKKLDEALTTGDLTAVDEAKRMIVIYDSLQLAHKCILNSFYGYVMRKGARWFSMEMAGIVCLTGAKIIQLARTRVERIGRPLELDTDGIWCILPKSFPETFNFTLKSGKSVSISYPCVMLNHLVHDQFTNHQYQDRVQGHEYATHSENSIFFEVDGPYRSMILPASTEEDRLLKKRYAVFNHDGTIAELKGFEIKRRGELGLIKNFQSNIFKVFLEGLTLEECYANVGAVANRWLDILYSRGADLSDAELFDLISENRSMSKSLSEYGAQKSTSISTAKRLAEFLGDQMVRDKGLACKFIIVAKPLGVPVSDRAVPIAIFQADPAVRRHFLRKWLRDMSIDDPDVREIVDWHYYIQRFASVIQKLITIPAAMQAVSNPVPRVEHPEWLSRRVAQQQDRFKQRRITDVFGRIDRDAFRDAVASTLDDGRGGGGGGTENGDGENASSGADVIPAYLRPESCGADVYMIDYMTWVSCAKQRWRLRRRIHGVRSVPAGVREKRSAAAMAAAREPPITAAVAEYAKTMFGPPRRKRRLGSLMPGVPASIARNASTTMLSSSIRTTANASQITGVQVLEIFETDIPGSFILWVLAGGGLQKVRLQVPRIFYMNCNVDDPGEIPRHPLVRITKKSRTLPRNHACKYLYQLEMPESFYIENNNVLAALMNHPDVDGVYETQVSLLFRALICAGCVCVVSKSRYGGGGGVGGIPSALVLDDVSSDATTDRQMYLAGASSSSSMASRLDGLSSRASVLFSYMFHASSGSRQILGVFLIPTARCHVFVVDPGNNRDGVPNMRRMYTEAIARQRQSTSSGGDGSAGDANASAFEYPDEFEVAVTVRRTEREAFAAANTLLRGYMDQRRGPTVLAIQSARSRKYFEASGLDAVRDMPVVAVPSHRGDSAFPAVGWQLYASQRMFGHLMNLGAFLAERIQLARYADVPLCNIESDYTLFLSDLFLARRLVRADVLLWYSMSGKPDLGGIENEDNQLTHDVLVPPELNRPGAFPSVCVEMDVWDLALNTVLQSNVLVDMDNALGRSTQNQPRIQKTGIVDGGSGGDKPHGDDTVDVAAPMMADMADRNRISPHVYSIFRGMVKNWTVEVRRRNPFASHLLEHLVRWVTSPAARFFDPALFRFVHDLAKQVFAQLIRQLQQLGADVVYASFEKLVVSTNKTTLANARGYMTYVIAALSKKEAFEHIEIKPMRFWRYLLWMDLYNWAGVDGGGCDGGLRVGDGGDQGAEVDMKWNMVEYLPALHQHTFMRVIADILEAVAGGFGPDGSNGHRRGGGGGVGPSTEAAAKRIGTVLDQTLKRQLMSTVQSFTKTTVQEAGAVLKQPGVHRVDANLEFVKCICAVLGLETELETRVRSLRRDLLAILRINEFSDRAIFSMDRRPLVLQQVICEYCSFCRDLDLTRERVGGVVNDAVLSVPGQGDDDSREVGSTTEAVTSRPSVWLCTACHMEYDRGLLEQQLVDMVVKRTAAWQLQDIRCSDCRFVMAEELRSHCPRCTSALTTTQHRDDLGRMLAQVEAIAEQHQMEMLRQAVAFTRR